MADAKKKSTLKEEWGQIHKPENVLKNTVNVLVICVIGSAVTGFIGAGVNAITGAVISLF